MADRRVLLGFYELPAHAQSGRKALTLTLLTWTIWRAPTNASKWRMGFNSAFKGITSFQLCIVLSDKYVVESYQKREGKPEGKIILGRAMRWFNPLVPEFSLKFYHTLYLKCEYYRNQKR